MERRLIGLCLFMVLVIFTGCTPLEENVVVPEETPDNYLDFKHTWKSGDTYPEFKNPEIKGTVILFTYEINTTTKDKFSAATINNVYEVGAIVVDAQNKYEKAGIKFLYVHS